MISKLFTIQDNFAFHLVIIIIIIHNNYLFIYLKMRIYDILHTVFSKVMLNIHVGHCDKQRQLFFIFLFFQQLHNDLRAGG